MELDGIERLSEVHIGNLLARRSGGIDVVTLVFLFLLLLSFVLESLNCDSPSANGDTALRSQGKESIGIHDSLELHEAVGLVVSRGHILDDVAVVDLPVLREIPFKLTVREM